MQALPTGMTCELCWTFFFSFFINHNLQHRVAEMALKEVFGASVLTNSQDCQSIFCVLESKTFNNIVTVREDLYFILFCLVSEGTLLTTI